jgi:hypothetical protein
VKESIRDFAPSAADSIACGRRIRDGDGRAHPLSGSESVSGHHVERRAATSGPRYAMMLWSRTKVLVFENMRLASQTKFGLMFVAHQVIVLWVVILSAPILTASFLNFTRLFGWKHVRSAYSWILNGTPYFPAHIALGLLLGWLLARSLRDRSMLWVWTLPTFAMGYALAAVPTLAPRLVLSGFQAGVGQSRWFHYFGSGCHLGNYCLDQTSFTRPFLASLPIPSQP